MSLRNYDAAGVVREFWDDATRTYTAYNASGVQTSTRAYTAAENAAADLAAINATTVSNGTSLRTKATTALTNNATYLAIASPTTAQAVAQVAALTRQVDALIKLTLNDLADTNGT